MRTDTTASEREVPTGQWPEVLDQFSRAHRGKAARLYSAPGISSLASRPDMVLPLTGVSLDGANLRIMFGPDRAVPGPRRLHLAEWNDAFSARLRVESADGSVIVIEVGPATQVLPPGVIL